jgi:hypothetical protein
MSLLIHRLANKTFHGTPQSIDLSGKDKITLD